MNNPFILDIKEYKKDVDLVKHYVDQASFFLSINTNTDIEQCKEFVKNQLKPGGKFEFKDPRITYTFRENFEDRVKVEGGLLEYINESLKNEDIIAPTLTTYVNPSVRESLLVSYVDGNIKSRGLAKKKMFNATMEKEKYTKRIKLLEQTNQLEFLEEAKQNEERANSEAIIQNTVQTNNKLSNNSLSGAHVSTSTPVANKTAHSSLTSGCRVTSSYGNANNEKFVAGNRHYFSYDTVIGNITSIISNTDYELLGDVVNKFNLTIPTVEDTFECIEYSTSLYFRDRSFMEGILKYVEKLNPLQRAAFVYTGDFYHLRKHNDTLVRELLNRLSSKELVKIEDPVSVFKASSDSVNQLAVQICDKEMKGVKIHDVFAVKEDDEGNKILDEHGKTILLDPKKALLIASVISNIYKTLNEYSLLIKGLWATKNFPSSVGSFPSSIRRVVLISDTDSTIFTVQEWVKWFFGELEYNSNSLAISAVMVFLTSETITHLLAQMSANIGVEEKRLFQIQMKNEFRFDVFVPTPITKHYYALIGCREGNLFSEFKSEIKGVHLRSSNAPVEIIERAHKMMKDSIMMSVINNKSIPLDDVLKEVADIEREVIESVKKGKYEYLRLSQIKNSEAYALDQNRSPYQHFLLWNEVFGPKYGVIDNPPYTAIKVATVLNTRRKMQSWIDDIKDRELANRMMNWLEKNDKKSGMGTFHVPDQILSATGFPEEIYDAIDIRRIVVDATGVFYHVLETLGVYVLEKTRSRLFHDYY